MLVSDWSSDVCSSDLSVNLRDAGARSQAFIIPEQKSVVLPKGPARRRSKLSTPERRLCGLEEIPRIQRTVSQELKYIPMQTGRSRPRGHADHSARRPAYLC